MTAPAGPLLVFAGAGSGKTRVLTMRIAHLVGEGADPQRILALTFTNRAAREMRARLEVVLGGKPAGLWAGTFHSIFLRLIRPHAELFGLRAGFSIFDEEASRALVKRALNELGREPGATTSALAEQISRAKADFRAPEEIPAKKAADQQLRASYEGYERLAHESNGMDFDDILLNTARLLRDHADVRADWQSRWDHVLVDEYQDTNAVQYEILKRLCEKHRSLTVVGDDDQSIYAFRGANVRNILDFKRDFPRARVIKLEQNYRSTKPILDVAHAVIEQNKERADKRLWSEAVEGPKPRLLLAPDDELEAQWVAEQIKEATAGHRRFGDFAILFRTNIQARPFERAFIARRLPYNLVGGLRFWDRREVKDLVSYMRFLANPSDAVAFDRIANVPKRGISERTAHAAIAAASSAGLSVFDACGQPALTDVRPDAQQSLARFHAEISTLLPEVGQRHPHDLLRLVARRCDLYAYYDDGSSAGRARLRNLEDLERIAGDYRAMDPAKALERFLSDVALASDTDELDDTSDRVTLITLHMAKGLEWDSVFLTGLEEKTLPHERALNEKGGLEEERRLCYVGITRARRDLVLTSSRERTVFGKRLTLAPSRFLSRLRTELVETIELGPFTHTEAGSTRTTD